MSSLQKFHRRTLVAAGGGGVVAIWPPITVGDGDPTKGFWLGTAGNGTSKLIVAPKSTEVQRSWGSHGTVRNTTSTTDGLTNTTILFGFGSAAHPAAYHAKSLTTGGYNTWYLPTRNELLTLYSNKSATPFSINDAFVGSYYWSSTEYSAIGAWARQLITGGEYGNYTKNIPYISVRAVRRY